MKRAKKKMPLHRDIYWVGKQWSVTGHGMQAIDQKLKGKFDIEVSRLWEDDLDDAMRDEKWFNEKDFDKGLAEARKHYPEPPNRAPSKASSKTPRKAAPALVVPPPPAAPVVAKDPPKVNPAPANFAMRIVGCRAKFLRTWRVRIG